MDFNMPAPRTADGGSVVDAGERSAKRLASNDNRITRGGPLLLIGFVLTLLSDMPGSADILAWFMPIPFLVYVARFRSARNRLWLLVVLVVASILTLAKTASDPLLMSVAFSVMSGTVTGLRFFIAYVLWDWIRKRTGNIAGILAFPVVIISLEYLQANYTPLGDWGALANTQLSNLPLLQTASLFGFLAISAMMAWAAVLMASMALRGGISRLRAHIAVFAVVFVALNVYGDLRLNQVPTGNYIRAAAIGTAYTFTGALPDPESPLIASTTDKLIADTILAAHQGAAIAVWAEASTIVTPSGEAQLLDQLTKLAKADHIAIVAAYAVLLPEGSPYHLENKFTWLTDTGAIAETYRKHHPVPGEGSVPGQVPLRVISTAYGKMAGAICYDFDFPQIALTYARLGADFVVLPGLDWRGMLRRHSLMARMRAIEGGFPILRPADGATSMAFDSRGRILASLPNFGNNDRVMLAYMPVGRTLTLYSRIGNVLAYLALLTLFVLLIVACRNGHVRQRRPHP
ncbi:Nitrilase/cyanide hydratase and apolipoprotein N-acyltransferase [Solidesulfovibrio fructosivorans JJ]]|uniref:Nitrilase/cyanide hydratase and apolipoprotein N-acyltransferase n=1 Tax=Solidesulfovibrio fructosivorans JJ] TaxID=596151 RepID=E1JRJ6_SOLFR|nr:nitrilase-related carbon-nitrogen hydrolase [Solidesulfovibrio fructosivorans]EFL53197.1 Nitrilase/cyanide hydratase and apolipoprotein N-acyltransferase [Solidesulfovibrio fructosivorans JJ]]